MTEGTPEPQGGLPERESPSIGSHDASTPTMPVTAGLSARTRWLIAAGGVVAAVAVVAVALGILGTRPTPEALTYIPRDADVVVELRPDLPGDQQQRVGNLLAHFPGFEDQSSLAQKLDESLARLTSTVSNGTVDYASQVKPWLAGPLVAAGDYPALMIGDSTSFVVVFTTDGTVTCEPFTRGLSTPESYRGLDISRAIRGGDGACAINDKQAIVGTLAGVKAAIDAHADHTGVDGVPAYQAARDKLGGDQLATMYLAYRQMTEGMFGSMPSGITVLSVDASAMAAALPEWAIIGLRAEDSALVTEMVMAPFDANATGLIGLLGLPGASPGALPSLLSPPPAHVSTLATMVPADTAVLYELHGAGATIHNVVASLRAMASRGGPYAELGQLDAALSALGGVDGLTGWIGDAGLVVLTDGATADGGVILLAPDEATASAKVDQVRGWITLAGQGLATTTETTIGDTTVTLVDFGDASTLLPLLGQEGGASPGLAIPPGTRLVLSVATHGSAVIIGSGESFARQVIETASGSSLADQPSYKSALGLVAASNAGQLYVAVPPLLALAEQLMPADQRASYQSDIKPYLEPFDALVATSAMEDDGMRARFVVTVK